MHKVLRGESIQPQLRHRKYTIRLPGGETTHEFCSTLQSKLRLNLPPDYVSLESLLISAIKDFYGAEPNLRESWETRKARHRRMEMDFPPNIIRLIRTPSKDIIAVDIERLLEPLDVDRGRDGALLEVDFFCAHNFEEHSSIALEHIRHALDLTEIAIAVPRFESFSRIFPRIRELAEPKNLADADAALDVLAVPHLRRLLTALKERGSVLGADAGDLVPGVTGKDALEGLRVLARDKPALLELKYAVVCTKLRELLFLAGSQEQVEGLSALECHRCGNRFSDERIELFFRPTESLKNLIDGGKWFPLLGRRHLLAAGVPPEDIILNSIIGGDEFDLLCLVNGDLLVGEFKTRQASLGDAYKFAAKLSHLRGLIRRMIQEDYRKTPMVDEEFFGEVEPPRFFSLIATTADMDKDATGFLTETLGASTLVATKADETLGDVLAGHVAGRALQDALDAFIEAGGIESPDSASRLAAFLIDAASRQWMTAIHQ